MIDFDALVAGGLLQEDVRLAPLTTYKFGGPARYYLEAHSDADLLALGPVTGPVLVVGRGSNLVVADGGFEGLVVHLAEGYVYVRVEAAGRVRTGGATPLPLLARETVRAGRGGLEFYAGIPGSVGGAVRQNAGGHGSDTAALLRSVRVIDLKASTITVQPAASLGLEYRHSLLREHEVVLEAEFETEPSTQEIGEQRLREIARWRREHQPGGTLNAGSVFKNPPGDSAGRLIDEAGLKGFRIGGAAVSHKHANFFEADPGARARDVYDLVAEVRERVGRRTGVWLVPEIRFAGDFTQ